MLSTAALAALGPVTCDPENLTVLRRGQATVIKV
jgi:hypothetical protein